MKGRVIGSYGMAPPQRTILRSRFMLAVIIYAGLIILLWAGYHNITHQALSRAAAENAALAADSITKEIGAEFARMNTVASVIAGSDYVQDFLRENDTAAYYEKAAAVSEIVRKAAYPISSADSVVTLGRNGSFFRFSGGLSDSACKTLYESLKDEETVTTVIELDGALFFCHSVPVADYSGKSPDRLGYAVILTGLSKTRRMLDYGDSVDMALTLNGVVILSNDPSLENITTAELEPGYGVFSIAPIAGTGLSAIAAVPDDAVFPENDIFLTIALVSLGLLLSMVYILYRYLSSYMIRPMASVISGVASLGGELHGRLAEMPVLGRPDFQSLVLSINDLLDRAEQYNTELLDERQKSFDGEIARKNMRLSLLATQIDSHFVINTLTNIKRLSDIAENDKIGQMAQGLAAILQYRYAGDVLVNVFDDFQILKTYVDIMNIKFDGKFAVEYDIKDDFETYLIPGMILQPIVENALTHGLGNKENDARLTLEGSVTENDILFEISDNGEGMPPDKLKTLQDALAVKELGDFPEPGLRGVALANVQRRIRIRFGDAYGIKISSIPGEGTTVTVSLPLISDN